MEFYEYPVHQGISLGGQSPTCFTDLFPRAGRIAPVSREMILNYVGMHSLGLPKSY